ncbi:hypothetical protein AAFC00_001465 [Neodothiora populina]|uniref:Topoisomerase 1-associated factor 1 n=1 Tax=Neodothiora populina TaxID=2781224 RepID=A0ABR3PP04_9PEZI
MDVFEKSSTVDPEVRAHVYSLVSAVGGNSNINDGQYVLGDDALACLRDISRWIRLYDDKTQRHDVKRCLAESNLVKGDLLEILAQWPETGQTSALRGKIAIKCLDLLKDLTWPITLEEDKATVNHHRHLPFLQLAQVGYKRAVLHHETAPILRTVIRIVVPIISMSKPDRTARDWQILSAALYFFRNIAIISQPQNLPSQGDENEVSRSTTIESFHNQHVLQLILTIASSINEEFPLQDVVILEILFQLLKGIDPKQLFKERKDVDQDRAKAFRALVSKEKAMMASYQKNAPSRHHRFGSMIWLKRPDQKMTTLSGQKVISEEANMLDTIDKSKSWNKPRVRSRQTEAIDETNDFAATVHIEGSTHTILRTFVEDFLDSSFNPLFNSLRRAVSSESDRVLAYNARQYYYLMGWFLQAERARQELVKKEKANQPASAPSAEEDSPFAYIAAVMTQENFVLLNRKMQQSLDDKEWSDLHACIHAFTEILHTVAAMSESSSEDDQEIAENIQSRIFYEETTHDLVISILKNYKEQGFRYLDSCTELAHVFTRMLERYSKQNVDLQVRSKRRARKKRKDAAQARGEEDQAENSEAEDEVEAHRTVSERKFDFSRLAAKFMTEPCIATFVRFTQYYLDLDEDQLKRAHRFFYRCAFKMERIILLYRVDILHLFQRMIKGPEGLRKDSPHFKDWEELVRQIFRRCIKKLEERRELMVEMLFTKMPQTLFYLEHGYDYVGEKRAPRPPAELVVKPGMTKEEEIGVAVGVLVNQGKLDDIAWIKKVLGDAADERAAWEDQHAAQMSIEDHAGPEDRTATDEPQEDSAKPTEDQKHPPNQPSPEKEALSVPSIVVKPEGDERKTALYKDKFLRLFLVLLQIERMGARDDPEASWVIPSALTSTDLRTNLDLIKKLEFDLPTFEEGVTPESLLRNKAAAGLHARADRGSASRDASRANTVDRDSDDGVGLSDIDELDERYAPGGPTARPAAAERPNKPTRKRRLRKAADEVADEEESQRKAEEKRKREREKDAKIKSTLRVTDSDDEDDQGRDKEFFRLEEQRRGRMKGVIRNELLKIVDEQEKADSAKRASKGRKRKSDVSEAATNKAAKTKKRKTTVDDDSEDQDNDISMTSDNDDSEDEEPPTIISSRESSSEAESVASDHSAAPRIANKPDSHTSKPRSETSANRVPSPAPITLDEDDEDDVVLLAKPTARRTAARGPFIVDSDSESE